MTRFGSILAALTLGVVMPSAAFAQASATSQPPTTAAAEVTACAQAQLVVDSLLTNANTQLETARQSNSPADMRAAIDALQTTIRDVRAQLAACANADAADPHAGHVVPAGSKPPADPHAGHGTTPAPAKPPAPKPPPVAPGTKPPATVVPAPRR